ncbi:unnamed protein product [Microthlaspi erraticum]|uniref:Uncharacterized protein n=1 Tax=Microthlaspi erraticum TaxID=1685480 RepID=A0A6D2HGJ9_9BRAS|nr:unnamed protein product [Microthlaspi erraticum]
MTMLGSESYAKTIPLNSTPVASWTSYAFPTANISPVSSPSATVTPVGLIAGDLTSLSLPPVVYKSRFVKLTVEEYLPTSASK